MIPCLILDGCVCSCTAASDMLMSNMDLRRKWTGAVEWLHEELERVCTLLARCCSLMLIRLVLDALKFPLLFDCMFFHASIVFSLEQFLPFSVNGYLFLVTVRSCHVMGGLFYPVSPCCHFTSQLTCKQSQLQCHRLVQSV